jgi:cysteine desulfuration protein SufE
MSIDDIQEEIIQEFELFPDWESRYEYVLEMGCRFAPTFDPAFAVVVDPR